MQIYPNIIRIVLNIFITVVVFGAWAKMFFETESGVLSSSGITSLKFFTVLSNILEGVASGLWLISLTGILSTEACDRLKFVACVSVTLTFLTVMLFLGPVGGYQYMFNGANLWFHLIIPVLAILEFVILNRTPVSFVYSFIALIPMTLYCVGYIGNLIKNGIEGNDWYGFFARGVRGGVIMNVIMGLGIFGVANLLRVLNARLFVTVQVP